MHTLNTTMPGRARGRWRKAAAAASLAALVGVLAPQAGADQTTTTPNGTWAAYPGAQSLRSTQVQQPINADGTSNFKSNGKGVIPVKMSLTEGTGPFVFESIGSDTGTANDYSYVSFTPTTAVTFGDITGLSAVYAFTQGDCHGGSLRWSVRVSPTQSVYVYYGTPPSFGNGGVGGCTAATGDGQTGSNLIGLSDLRYDTTQVGGTFYDTYAHAVELVGTMPIVRASLVLDSGWGGDQQVTLTSATFATGAYTDTFTPPAATTPSATCPTAAASIQVTKVSGSPSGAVNEPVSVQPGDDNGLFRIVDCKYVYNLATSSLSGVGRYKVEAVIGGTAAGGAAYFDLR